MPGDPSRSICNANHRALVMTLAERVASGILSYGISSWIPSGAACILRMGYRFLCLAVRTSEAPQNGLPSWPRGGSGGA